MNYFAADHGIQLIILTPFYAQANGQVEASNKVLIGMLEKNSKDKHKILSETLWAYMTSKRTSTRVSIFFSN